MNDEPEDFGFYIDEGTPIAGTLLESVEKQVAEQTPEWIGSMPLSAAVHEALRRQSGLDAYIVGGVAELERRVIALEDIVRDLMAR